MTLKTFNVKRLTLNPSPMPRLNADLILSEAFQSRDDIVVPTREMLLLPEKVLQFGTGGFLRGFCDYFIDQANRQGAFGGRVVMVGSTGSNRTQILNEQDGLYTLRIQGIDDGEVVEQYHVVGAVSRVLAANTDWDAVLAFARNPALDVIISNTTEVGIAFDPEPAMPAGAPASFPAKLTAVLYERARAFNFDAEKGVTVLPCELIDQNGDTLKSIVQQIANTWALDDAFAQWLDNSTSFCNTLVDRIVPGAPTPSDLDDIEARLRFEDAMLTTAEVYRLWPIACDEKGRSRLGFAEADPGVILTDDVKPFKERKVRILNGAHTSSVPLAFLCGEKTVLSMMRNELTGSFVSGVIQEEIVPSLDVEGGATFARQVIERFNNPFLRHRLIDITLQSTSKWRLRLMPSLVRFVEKTGRLPLHICLGFAAYLVFMRVVEKKEGGFFGETNGKTYPIRDDQAAYFEELWMSVDPAKQSDIQALVSTVGAHTEFWERDLNMLPGFVDTVAGYMAEILSVGALKTLRKFKGA